MAAETLLGGLPLSRWVGRRVRYYRTHAGRHRMGCCRLVSVVNDRFVLARPDNHAHDERINVSELKPWWAQNPDLHEEVQALLRSTRPPPPAAKEPSVDSKPKTNGNGAGAVAPPRPPAVKPRRNFLSQRQAYEFWTWLEGVREQIEQERLTEKDIATRAAAALGFPLSVANVHSGLENLGITLASAHAQRGGRLSGIEQQLLRIVPGLYCAVVELYHDLGKPVPSYLPPLPKEVQQQT